MAKTTTIKAPVKEQSAVVAIPTASPTVAKTGPTVLTVVVLDDKSQPISGARVSITPSDTSAVTNASGEAQFTLGDAMKYNVTATAGSNTVTVPYYVTKNGATRLVVNPQYVKMVEAQLHPQSFFSSGLVITVSILVIIVVVAIVFWSFFLKKFLSKYKRMPTDINEDLN